MEVLTKVVVKVRSVLPLTTVDQLLSLMNHSLIKVIHHTYSHGHNLVYTSNFAWLTTCNKTFLELLLHKAQIFSNNKVMSNPLILQIWTLYVFPNKRLKWQIWKCELG